ncbi:DsbA family protein [Pseudooceanicola sp. LIPI14-2-Ac024]|uniref:DsbA family protein n=1 Tax=Pseudooceanicola sp. LIPI14-2-Ac024 TaxID=3344875 RepID=UPI0035D0F1FC
MDRRTLILGGGAVVAVGALGGFWLTRQQQGPAMTQIMSATTEPTLVSDTSGITEMVMGDENAPVTVMEYASFTCPHCASFHQGPFQQLKSEYIDTGKVKFVYRDVYFDRFGLWAAMIARCDPNRFFGISSMLYEQQKDWLNGETPAAIADNLRKIGRVAGLTDAQMEECLADEENAKALVSWFETNAAADEVSGTPTLFIDGKKHSNMNWNDLKALLDEALES